LNQGKLLNQRYEILELVGGGGMSLIYRAMDVQNHRIVAIKVLRSQYTSDPAFITRFRREGISVSGLDHPNIVKIYGVGQDEDIYYLVMEMIEGKDLKQVLQESGPFSGRQLYPMAAQICEAIAYAHHKRIIHRDIKPHNIIVRPDGQIKVTDFGIARAASEATMTHTGSIMGSVHYLSPEQAKGEIADERSDIYSLGVLLYEMATGKLPYEGESPISVAVQKIQQDPVPPREANPELSEAIEMVIQRAMHRDPRKRYQSALELKDDLREACFNNRVLYVPAPDPMQDTLQRVGEPGELKAAIERNNQQRGDRSGSAIGRPGKGGGAPWLRWGLLLMGLIAAGLVIGMGISALLQEPVEITVPNLIGVPYEEALDMLAEKGLKGELSEEKASHTTVAKDAIAIQDPSEGVPVKEGSIVKLTLSAGPDMVEVPDLKGYTRQEAVVALTNLGLVLSEDIQEMHHDYILKGSIISQEPEANEQVRPNTEVSVVISKGPVVQLYKVQSFVGMPLEEAVAAAQALGIEFGTIGSEMSWTHGKDVIIRQSPVGDTEVPVGTKVDLVISSGPGPEGNQ
jgi:beta-lactam-binding protein with PASTA domain